MSRGETWVDKLKERLTALGWKQQGGWGQAILQYADDEDESAPSLAGGNPAQPPKEQS